jgi:hypothetical protein
VTWERWPGGHRRDGHWVEPNAPAPAAQLLGCTLFGVELARRGSLGWAAVGEATCMLRGCPRSVRVASDGRKERVRVRVGWGRSRDDDLGPAAPHCGQGAERRWSDTRRDVACNMKRSSLHVFVPCNSKTKVWNNGSVHEGGVRGRTWTCTSQTHRPVWPRELRGAAAATDIGVSADRLAAGSRLVR